MMKLLLFFSIFPLAFCIPKVDNRDTKPGSPSVTAGRQDFTLQLARRASVGTAAQHLHNEAYTASAQRRERSRILQRRGACMGKPDCMSPRPRGNTGNRALQPNTAPERTTRSTGTQTATPPGSPKENTPRNTAEVTSAEHRVSAELRTAGSGSLGSRRSNSPTPESRDKLAPLSRTTTGTKDSMSNQSTPGNSRPGSAQSRRQSATSGKSHADSMGMLEGEQGTQNPLGPDTRRPSSAGSALPRLQSWIQPYERPKSADSIASKNTVHGAEQSYSSRRTTQTSDGSGVARWWMK